MKNVGIKLFLLAALIWTQSVAAQDIQEIYDAAKESLLKGDYIAALTKISDAKARIAADPRLDPNGVFNNRLLPRIENAAIVTANFVTAMEQLYQATQTELEFLDVPLTANAVNQHAQQTRQVSEQLIAKRDSILSSIPLDPEFRDALRNTPAFRQIEQLAVAGIIEKLATQFSSFVALLTDSINAVNSRYQSIAANLEKMKKDVRASKAERKKLEDQLTALSQERSKYMNAISEILIGETTASSDQVQMVLMDRNLDNVFASAITSEIERVQAISEIDSAGYRGLVNNYERMKKYNEIFAKNNVTGDQSALLAQYEAAIKHIKMTQPDRRNYLLYVGIAVAGLIMIFAAYKIVVSLRKTKTIKMPPDQTGTRV